MAKNFMVRKLEDDYEASQLNPVYSNKDNDKSSAENIEKLLDKLPEKESLKMRIAVFEAIVDDIIEDALDTKDQTEGEEESKSNPTTDKPSTPSTTEVIKEAVEPMIEKAVALHIIPSSVKNNINQLIANRLRYYDPRVALLEKTAHFVTGALCTMNEEDTVVSEALDDKPADTGVDINEEQVEFEGSTETTESDAPVITPAVNAMKYLAASAVNHRKATALVSRRLTGVLLERTLKQLRNHLPKSFKTKYKID